MPLYGPSTSFPKRSLYGPLTTNQPRSLYGPSVKLNPYSSTIIAVVGLLVLGGIITLIYYQSTK